MSEVTDAVQVIMLCGRSAMLLGNISLKVALQIIKLMNTIYLAKWEGSVSLSRLRQIKGDDFVFINVSSENQNDLTAVEKEMKAHGILYARMPDLCGGDARTQYAIASSDAVKMKAMLLDHTTGPNRHIRVGPISEADYMMTGKKADGTDTKEMQGLNRSAKERAVASDRKRKRTREKPMDPVTDETRAAVNDPGIQSQVHDFGPVRRQPVQEEDQAKEQILRASDDVRVRAREHQFEQGNDSVFWIRQKPVYENRSFAQFMMPDGKTSIFIRQEDILPGRDAETGTRLAALFTNQRYSMMNMEKVNVTAADGTKAIAMFKLPGGAVVAHGSQQPDRQEVDPKSIKIQDGLGKTSKVPNKMR